MNSPRLRKKTPKVSIIMPAYNAAEYIFEAINSMLNQTFTNFELLVIDDNSRDKTVSIVNSFNDSRIRIILNLENKGISYSLNRGISESAGEYIARMDADDISMPSRLERQIGFLEENRDIGICGTWAVTFGNSTFKIMPECEPELILFCMMLDNRFVHPSVIIRKSVLYRFRLRYSNVPAEDYDLFSKLVFCTKVANIPEFLLKYRTHANQLTSTKAKLISEHAQEIRKTQLFNLIGKTKNIEGFDALRQNNFTISKIIKILEMIETILKANQLKEVYDQNTIEAFFKKKLRTIYRVLKKGRSRQTTTLILTNKKVLYKSLGLRRFLFLLVKSYLSKK